MIVSNWYHSQPIASDKITIHLLLCSNPMVVVHLLENNLASSSWSYFHISRQRYEKHFLLTLIWGIVPYLGKSWPLFGTMCSLFGIVKFRANLHTPYWPIIPRILPYVMEISWPNTLAGEDVAKKKKRSWLWLEKISSFIMEGGFLFDPLDNSRCLHAALTA